MKFYRIKSLVLRNMRLTFKGFIDPFFDFIYWPFLDIIIWGFTSRWISTQDNNNNNQISLALLTCLVFWQASYRANLDISLNLLSELWYRNIVNLFATPLKLSEWIISAMILGLINAAIAVSFGGLALWIFYEVNILTLSYNLLPFFLSLVMSGWVIGFFSAATLFRFGQKIQKLVWSMGWFFIPLSAVYYPLASLPHWAQAISSFVPMAYVFEGIRIFIATKIFPVKYIIISFGLNIFYGIFSLLFFKHMFELSKSKGLARLENE